MRQLKYCILIILTSIYLSACNPRVQHADEFYNNDGDFPYLRFPLIKPYYVDRADSNSPWRLNLDGLLWAPPPNQDYYYYVEDLEKLSVKDGIIMAYSPYVDEQANQSIQDNYYHWFILIPNKKVAVGFTKEEEFLGYVQKLGIQQPNWQAPDNVFNQFLKTGCLDWIPDCK
jgi:hypothetical protein